MFFSLVGNASNLLAGMISMLLIISNLNPAASLAETTAAEKSGFQIIDYDVPAPSDTGSITASGTADEQISWTFQNHILTLTGCGTF